MSSSRPSAAGTSPRPTITTPTIPASAAFDNSQATSNIPGGRELRQPAPPVQQQHDCDPATAESEVVHSRVSLAPSGAAGSTPAKSSKRLHLRHRPDAYACKVEVKDENLDDATVEQGCADGEEPAGNERNEPDDNSAVQSVASAESRVQPQVALPEVANERNEPDDDSAVQSVASAEGRVQLQVALPEVANERNEPDDNSAIQSVASAGSRVQPQVALPEVDATAPVAPPVSRHPARRSHRSNVGEICVAHRTRARSGRRLAHRVAGVVRATRPRVRAGEAYLVAGID